MKQNFTTRYGALDGVEVFLGVARHRNFRRAAAELGVTPSAVSQAIKKLESDLGAKLLNHKRRSFELAENGAALFERAKAIFSEIEKTESVLNK